MAFRGLEFAEFRRKEGTNGRARRYDIDGTTLLWGPAGRVSSVWLNGTRVVQVILCGRRIVRR